MSEVTAWSLAGAAGEAIIGDAHAPAGAPRATVVVAHGFKGYKDYGMFPYLARTLAAAGCVVHRFNFSHSGMTNDVATFARPDLFERDTWSRQVEDLVAIDAALASGGLAGGDHPVFWLGHSRGGASVLLAAGRGHLAGAAGLITLAAPDQTCSLDDAQREALRSRGWIASPSNRTGQELRVGAAWLLEQEADPAGHDLLALVKGLGTPVLVLHGEADPTVPANCAASIGAAIGPSARVHVIEAGDHVFNTPNPMPEDTPSPQLGEVVERVAAFVGAIAAEA